MKAKAVISSVFLLGCSGNYIELNTVHKKMYENVISSAFEFWNREIGYMVDFDITVTDELYHREGLAYFGRCTIDRTPFSARKGVILYATQIGRSHLVSNEKENFLHARNYLWYEMVHVHKTCSDQDHKDDPDDIMHPFILRIDPIFDTSNI